MEYVDHAKAVADYHAQNPQPVTYTPEEMNYVTAMAGETLAQRAEQATKGADPFARAVDNFKNTVAEQGITNIHQQVTREIKFDVEAARKQAEAAPSTDVDAKDFEATFSLAPGAVEKLQLSSNNAKECLSGLARASAAAATDDDFHEAVAQINLQPESELTALNNRINAELSRWNSARYGTDAANCNSVQAVERGKVIELAIRQSLGLQAKNLQSASIETLLRRSRCACDPDYQPATPRKQQSPQSVAQQKERAGYRNIHEALQNCPW